MLQKFKNQIQVIIEWQRNVQNLIIPFMYDDIRSEVTVSCEKTILRKWILYDVFQEMQSFSPKNI